jgi:carboxypeptidase Q
MSRPSSRRAHGGGLQACAGVSVLAACVVLLGISSADGRAQTAHAWLNAYRADALRLIKAAQADDFAYRRLTELTDTFGARLNGSENLERAIDWAVETMKADGLENVRTEPVMVPHWVRGRESAEIIDPPQHSMAMLGLGGSVGTPPGGIEADVITVATFDDLQARRAEARGKIVLLNAAFTTYSDTVTVRTNGARIAAQHGAVAVLVRSVGPVGLRTPHTGSVQYMPGQAPIPAAAIAAEDANRIARLTAGGRRVRVRLNMEARTERDIESANVVGEIRGRERPDEIVLLGGHIDSWDVGAGASDDGVGCIVTWEALRLMKVLGLRPRRTVRLVLFTNEENGFGGADAYAARYKESAGKHVFALEADSGVFAPAVLGFSGSPAARSVIGQIATLVSSLGFASVGPTGGGADIGPIAEAGNVPTMAYLGETAKYFVIHHTAADTVERIAPDEVTRAAAAIAVMSYVVADMPERLPR